MTRTDSILGESFPTSDRPMLVQEANRRVNMTGWRYSDALRAELDTYRTLGSEGYRKLHEEATRVTRGLGY